MNSIKFQLRKTVGYKNPTKERWQVFVFHPRYPNGKEVPTDWVYECNDPFAAEALIRSLGMEWARTAPCEFIGYALYKNPNGTVVDHFSFWGIGEWHKELGEEMQMDEDMFISCQQTYSLIDQETNEFWDLDDNEEWVKV